MSNFAVEKTNVPGTDTMIIILNPKYEHLRRFVCEIEDRFSREGTVVRSGRNTIKTMQVEDLTLYVKHYDTLRLRRRISVRTRRTPRRRKVFLRPLQLRERGFESLEPVAYVSLRKGLMSCSTYLICLQSGYTRSMADWDTVPETEREELLRSFAKYTARLHERGFLLHDYSSDNILYEKVDGKYRFSLFDTNDMSCRHKVSVERGCRNMARLNGDMPFFDKLIRFYAEERGADAALCREYFDRAKKNHYGVFL